MQRESIKLGSNDHVVGCSGLAVNGVLRTAMKRESTDNLSVVLLTFKALQTRIGTSEFVQSCESANESLLDTEVE